MHRLAQILRSLDELDEVELATVALRATEALSARLDGHTSDLPAVLRRGWAPAVTVAVEGLRILAKSLRVHRPPAAAFVPPADCPSDSLLQELG